MGNGVEEISDSDAEDIGLSQFRTLDDQHRLDARHYTEPAVMRSETDRSPPTFPKKHCRSAGPLSRMECEGKEETEAAQSRLDQAANPLLLFSQDIFSVQKEDNDVPVITVDPCNRVSEIDPESTDEEFVAPVGKKLDFGLTDEELTLSENINKELPRQFYFFLTTCNMPTLRSVAKDFELRQAYGKNILVARIFMTFLKGFHNGETELGLLLSGENEATFDLFKERMATQIVAKEMPCLTYLLKAARAEKLSAAPKLMSCMKLPTSRALARVTGSSSCTQGSRQETESWKRGKKRPSEMRRIGNNAKKLRSKVIFCDRRAKLKEMVLNENSMEIVRVTGEDVVPAPSISGRRQATRTGQVGSDRPTGNTVAGDAIATVQAVSVPREVPMVGAPSREASNGGLSTSEFARLLLLLKDDEDCRRAFLNSSQSLTRQQLDMGERSTDFWIAIVEPAFNDEGFKTNLDFSPVVPNVDPSEPPASHRTWDYLCTAFKSFRSKFITILFRYNNKSGRNGRDFKTFLAENGPKASTALGRRLIVAGFIFGLGGLNPDYEFLHSIGRTIGENGKSGYDVRIGAGEEDCARDGDVFVSGMRRAKKKKKEGELHDQSMKTLNAIQSCAEKYDKYQELRLRKTKDNGVSPSPVTPQRRFSRSLGTPTRSGVCLLKEKYLAAQGDTLRSISIARRNLCEAKAEGDEWMARQFEEHIADLKKHHEDLNKQIALLPK